MSAIIDIGRLLRFTFSLLLILPNIAGFNNDLEWKLIKEEDNIQVFARIAENSSIKEIRITCSVKTTMERMESFLSDVPKYADWVYKCDTSILLNTSSSLNNSLITQRSF